MYIYLFLEFCCCCWWCTEICCNKWNIVSRRHHKFARWTILSNTQEALQCTNLPYLKEYSSLILLDINRIEFRGHGEQVHMKVAWCYISLRKIWIFPSSMLESNFPNLGFYWSGDMVLFKKWTFPQFLAWNQQLNLDFFGEVMWFCFQCRWLVIEANDEGDYFPLYGVCLGFELLTVLVTQVQALVLFSSSNKDWFWCSLQRKNPSHLIYQISSQNSWNQLLNHRPWTNKKT